MALIFNPGGEGEGGGSVPDDVILPSPYFYDLVGGKLMLMKNVSGQHRTIMAVDDTGTQISGSMTAGLGSFKLGLLHAIGSGGENVSFVNRLSGVAWFPTWQGVSRDGQTLYEPVKRVIAPTTDAQPFGTKESGSYVPCSVDFTTTTRSAYFITEVEFSPDHSGYQGFISWRISRTDGDQREIGQFFREIDLTSNLSYSLTLDYPFYIDANTPIRLEILDDMGDHMSVSKASGGSSLPWVRFTEALYQGVDINAFEAEDDNTGQGVGRWFKPSARVGGGVVISGMVEVDGPDFN